MIPLAAALIFAFVPPPLPDPLLSGSGQAVTTAAQWRNRRSELESVIQQEGIGHIPPAPSGLAAQVLESRRLEGGKTAYRLIRLTWTSAPGIPFDVALFAPDRVSAVIVHPAFAGTPGAPPPPHPDRWYQSQTPEAFAAARSDALGRGYAILTFYYQELALDRKDNRATGFYPAFPGTDAGSLAVWAWGVSRAVDYLETQSFGPIVVVGHSRLGKTALIAAAFDERIAEVVVAGSGAGGTGAFRVNGKTRAGKEGLDEVTYHFPYWFSPRLPAYRGHPENLPYDAHELMALVAPRALLDSEAYGDASASGKAAVASYRAVLPVYELLGAADRIGLNFRAGKHELNDDDWQAILDFSDHQLKGAPFHRPFHTIPDDALLH